MIRQSRNLSDANLGVTDVGRHGVTMTTYVSDTKVGIHFDVTDVGRYNISLRYLQWQQS